MKRFYIHFIITSMLALQVLSMRAAETDSDRGTSVYDEHPECMERTDSVAPNPNCTPSDGPPRRKVIGARTAPDKTKGGNEGAAQPPGNKADAEGPGSAGAQGSAGWH